MFQHYALSSYTLTCALLKVLRLRLQDYGLPLAGARWHFLLLRRDCGGPEEQRLEDGS